MLRALVGSKRSKCLSRQRRGLGRAAVFPIVALAILAGGCGGDAATDSEKAADVEVLNVSLSQELTAIDAYEWVLPLLDGQMLAVAREFRGQDQAHVDALTKVIRGLGGEVDAEASEREPPRPQGQAEALTLLYEKENAALDQAQGSSAHLLLAASRTLAAALAASHAQHLAILRQGLGAGLLASVPEPFEPGDLPPPTTSVASQGEMAGDSAPARKREGG